MKQLTGSEESDRLSTAASIRVPPTWLLAIASCSQ
jgi:hypothetical protein